MLSWLSPGLGVPNNKHKDSMVSHGSQGKWVFIRHSVYIYIYTHSYRNNALDAANSLAKKSRPSLHK